MNPARLDSDIWSLGVIIVYALTGELPFRRDSGSSSSPLTDVELSNLIIQARVTLPPSLREPFRSLAQGCLRQNSQERWSIDGGEFWMGSPAGEGDDDERPRHRVTLSGFYLGKYSVTNAQWKGVMVASCRS